MSMGTVGFGDFFEAVTGHQPYVWQSRAAAVLVAGEPVGTIAAPTGMGKTSLVLAWVWALARDLDRAATEGGPRRVALRYVSVIDRRVVVDATAALAHGLADLFTTAVAAPATVPEPVVEVAQALARLAPDAAGPLEVRVLRGGMDSRPEGPRHPAAATVLVGTIDLVGSRLLWRGYGVSRGRRPIDAAMVGADSLIVLDEAHLAAQFHTTLAVLARQTAAEPGLAGIPARQLVTMTATPEDPADAFDWAAEIDRNPAVATRQHHRRAMTVELASSTGKAETAMKDWLKKTALDRQCIVCFFNTATAARDAAKSLTARTDLDGRAVLLLMGGMPDLARTQAMDALAPYLSGASPEQRATATPLIICATQTLEVGADLDADMLITPIASVAALTQRLGRINRIGARPDGHIILFAGTDPDPVYPDAHPIAATLTRHQPATAGELTDHLTALPTTGTDVTAVLPRHVFDAYLATAGSSNEPEVGRWLRTPQDERTQLQVVFRESVHDLTDDQTLCDHLLRWPPRPEEIWTIAGNGQDLVWPSATKTLRAVVIDTADSHPPRVLTHRPHPRPGEVYVLAPTPGVMGVPGFGTDLIATLPPDQRPFIWEPETPQANADSDDPTTTDPIGAEDNSQWLVEPVLDPAGEPTGWQVRSPAKVTVVEGTLAGVAYPLQAHQADVAARVRAWSTALGLNPSLTDDLVTAAAHHDEGKRDPRIQTQLHMTLEADGSLNHIDDDQPLAKSALPARRWRQAKWLAGVPDGLRHEAGSAVAVDELVAAGELEVHDVELVRHLVLSHHGHFRGVGPWLEEESGYQDPSDSRWASRAGEFAALNRRYGPYALALAESIVRLADWYESGVR